jgi:hypothetical protein
MHMYVHAYVKKVLYVHMHIHIHMNSNCSMPLVRQFMCLYTHVYVNTYMHTRTLCHAMAISGMMLYVLYGTLSVYVYVCTCMCAYVHAYTHMMSCHGNFWYDAVCAVWHFVTLCIRVSSPTF